MRMDGRGRLVVTLRYVMLRYVIGVKPREDDLGLG